MKSQHLLLALLTFVFLSLGGCGGGDGLNGAVTVTATATGSEIGGTVTYTHPTQTNLIGQEIRLSYRVGNSAEIDLGTFNTNNSGRTNYSFQPLPFNGSQTITVIARADKLQSFASVQMTGLSLVLTAPPAVTVTQVNLTEGQTASFTIPATPDFLTVTDPFATDAVHTFRITQTISPSEGNDVRFDGSTTTTVTTDVFGKAGFPVAQVTMEAPAIGSSSTMTITWQVTEVTTDANGAVVEVPGGLKGTATTTVTLNNNSGA